FTTLAFANLPTNTVVTAASRVWNDANRDGVPQPSELGPLSDSQFGNLRASNVRYADDVLNGSGIRPYQWQTSAGLQHELRPNWAMTFAYFRTWYGNFRVTDNQAIDPQNFDPYCITLAADPRLPGSGSPMCGYYDIQPASF